jgi:hypothetical protein
MCFRINWKLFKSSKNQWLWPAALNERSTLVDISQMAQQDYAIVFFLLSCIQPETSISPFNTQRISCALLPHVNKQKKLLAQPLWDSNVKHDIANERQIFRFFNYCVLWICVCDEKCWSSYVIVSVKRGPKTDILNLVVLYTILSFVIHLIVKCIKEKDKLWNINAQVCSLNYAMSIDLSHSLKMPLFICGKKKDSLLEKKMLD